MKIFKAIPTTVAKGVCLSKIPAPKDQEDE